MSKKSALYYLSTHQISGLVFKISRTSLLAITSQSSSIVQLAFYSKLNFEFNLALLLTCQRLKKLGVIWIPTVTVAHYVATLLLLETWKMYTKIIKTRTLFRIFKSYGANRSSFELRNWRQFFYVSVPLMMIKWGHNIFKVRLVDPQQLWQCCGVILSSIRATADTKNWRQFVYYNNKSSEVTFVCKNTENTTKFMTFLN